MPGLVSNPAGAAKRKRQASKTEPVKRSRSESSDDDSHGRILLLENEIFESKKHYNNISTLIQILQRQNETPEESLIAAIALCRVFSRFMASGEFVRKRETTEKETVVIQWLKERYTEYKTALLALLSSASGSTALTLSLRILKNEGTHLRNGQEYSFPTIFLTNIVRVVLSEDTADDLRQEFSEKYVEEYDDIRYYTFEAVQ